MRSHMFSFESGTFTSRMHLPDHVADPPRSDLLPALCNFLPSRDRSQVALQDQQDQIGRF